MILQRNGSDQGQTTHSGAEQHHPPRRLPPAHQQRKCHLRKAELSAAADSRLPDGLKQRHQQDAHNRCNKAQEGTVHRSQSVQVTPEEQETTNQQERGEEKINKKSQTMSWEGMGNELKRSQRLLQIPDHISADKGCDIEFNQWAAKDSGLTCESQQKSGMEFQ